MGAQTRSSGGLRMNRYLAALALVLVSFCAQAQDGRRYAVLSLVGDKLLVVQREPSVGSHLDKNMRIFVELPDNSIDRAVVLAVDDELRRANPRSTPVLLASRDIRLYNAASVNADQKDGIARVFAAVKPVVSGTNATHLVLITKHRHRAMLRLADGHVGSGTLEGVGFYVDHGTFARSIHQNDAERGFIAPFTYLRIALVEIATGRVVAEEKVIGSEAVSHEVGSVGNAWLLLSEEEKVARLTSVIRDVTAKNLPRVLAQR